jgi:protein-serine/threonine kinase
LPPSFSLHLASFHVCQRHVTRQKILNWKQALRFPSRPRVSHAAVNLMEQLLCEPEDRLGSQSGASVSRPDSLVIQARRSGFVNPNLVGKGSVDGVELIKVGLSLFD